MKAYRSEYYGIVNGKKSYKIWRLVGEAYIFVGTYWGSTPAKAYQNYLDSE